MRGRQKALICYFLFFRGALIVGGGEGLWCEAESLL